MRRQSSTAAALALLFSLAIGWTADGAVLGQAGETFEVRSGDLRELDADAPETPILILSIRTEDGRKRQLMVPGTDDLAVEASAFLVYEEASQTAYLAWVSRENGIHTAIKLIGYHSDGAWSEQIQVSDRRLSWKSMPRLAVTRDSYAVAAADAGEPPVTVQRSVIHMMWIEERGEGTRMIYSPLVLLDGTYVGRHAIFVLDEMLAPETATTEAYLPPVAPVLQASSDAQYMIAGFVLPATGRFVTVRLSVLAAELAILADRIAVWIEEHHEEYPDIRSLAEGMRGHMIDIGARLDPQLLRHIAGGMRGHMIDIGATVESRDVRRLAGDMRGHMIDIGLSLEARGLRKVSSGGRQTFDLLASEALMQDVTDPTPIPFTQLSEISLLHDRALPASVTGAEALIGSGGRRLLIAWDVEQAVAYVESEAGGWSQVYRIRVDESVSRQKAMQLLIEKVNQ